MYKNCRVTSIAMLQTLSHFFAAKCPEGWRGAEVCYRAQRRRIFGGKFTDTVVQPFDRPQNMKNGLKFQRRYTSPRYHFFTWNNFFSDLSKTNKITVVNSRRAANKLLRFSIHIPQTDLLLQVLNFLCCHDACTRYAKYIYLALLYLHSFQTLLLFSIPFVSFPFVLQCCKKGRCVATLKCISPRRSLAVMACIVSSKHRSSGKWLASENIMCNL